MVVGIFDFETGGFYADSSILLCMSIKTFGKSGIKTIRPDGFKAWKKNKTNEKEFIQAIADEFDKYDILVAHNGQSFDKSYFNAKCLQ